MNVVHNIINGIDELSGRSWEGNSELLVAA